MSEVKETTNTIAGTALAAQIDAAKPETAEEQEIRLLKETLTKQKEHLLEVAKLRQPLTEGLWLAESIPVGNHIFLNLDLELTKALANNDTQTASKIAEIALKLAQKQLQEHGLLNLMTASHSITALKIWLRSGSEAGPAKDHLDEITRRMLNIDLASTRNFDLYEKQLAELALVGSQLGANPSQTRQLLVGITNSIGKNRENKNYIGILEDLSDIRTEEAKDFTRHIAISLAQNEIQYQPLVGHITDMLLKKDLHDEALDFTEQIKKHQSEPNRTRLLLNSAAAYIQNGFLDEAYETLSDCVLLEIQESSLLERIFESGFDITHLTPELKAALLRFAKADNRAYLIIKVIATLFEQGKESQALLIAKEVESNQTIVGVASRLLLSKLTVEARSLIKSKNISAKDSAPYYVTLAKALPIKEYITELTHYDLDQETQASFIGLYAAQHKRFIASNVPLGGRMLTADSQESIQRDAAEFTELIETVFSTPEYQQEVGLLLAITKLTRELPIHASVVQKVVEKLTPALESLSCTPETVAQYLEGHAVLSQHNPAISAREVYETALPHIPTQDASIHLATLIRIANNTNDAELSNTLHNLLNQKETATQSSSERAQLLEQFLYGNELEKAEAFLTDATTETAELVVLDLFFQGKGSQALEILKRFPTVPSARFIQYSIAANAPYIGELTEFITKIGEKSNYGDLAKIIEMLLLTDHIAEGLQAISTLITFKQRYIIDNLSESFKLLTEAGKDGPLQVVITRLLREEGIQYSHILAELTSLKNTSVLLDVLAQAEADLKENPTRPQLKSISYAYNEAYRYLRNQGKEKEAEHYLQLFRTNTFETYFIDELAWKKITHFLEQTQGSPLPEISGKDLADLRDTLQKLRVFPRIADFQRVFLTEFCRYFRFCDSISTHFLLSVS